jgi:hypothetical protein
MQNKQFRENNNKLTSEGYNSTQPVFEQISQNHTKVTIPYTREGEEAKITAEYVNGSIKNISVDKKAENNNWWWFLLIIPVIGILGLLSSRFLRNEKAMKEVHENIGPFDYKDEARKMLLKAKGLFESGNEKDAFEKISHAIRFYFSNKIGINMEITNAELFNILGKKGVGQLSEVKECLDLCSQVEFAKYKPYESDFNRALNIARSIIA